MLGLEGRVGVPPQKRQGQAGVPGGRWLQQALAPLVPHSPASPKQDLCKGGHASSRQAASAQPRSLDFLQAASALGAMSSQELPGLQGILLLDPHKGLQW